MEISGSTDASLCGHDEKFVNSARIVVGVCSETALNEPPDLAEKRYRHFVYLPRKRWSKKVAHTGSRLEEGGGRSTKVHL